MLKLQRLPFPVLAFIAFCCLCAMGAVPSSGQAPVEDFVRAHYTKYEFRIPMRDGKRLFTAVYVPKTSAFPGDAGPYPFLMDRTPYSVAPYGEDQYPKNLGPSDEFEKAGYIFVYQDVRGRWMSEGDVCGDAAAHRRQEVAAGRGRCFGHLRHDRVSAEECAEQQRQGGHLGHFVSGVLHFGVDHRFAPGAGGGQPAGADDRSVSGRRRLSRRGIHAVGELWILCAVLPSAERARRRPSRRCRSISARRTATSSI